MLKGNLSTRPFYNDRLVTLAIALATLVVLVATLANLSRIYALTTQRSSLHAQIEADTREADRIRAQAAAAQGSVDRTQLARLAASAREANGLIDQRTFSWTRLLGQLEDTLPAGVRLTSVAPRAELGQFRVALAVVARDLDDIDELVEALLGVGDFYDVAPLEQRAIDDGTFHALIQASYIPSPAAGADAPPAEGPAQ